MRLGVLAIGTAAAALLWGWLTLFSYAARPGAQQAAPPRLDRQLRTAMRLASGDDGAGEGASEGTANDARRDALRAPLLAVFVHPRCSCTIATLAELDALLGEEAGGASEDRLHLAVVAYAPGKATEADAQASASVDSSAFNPGEWLHRTYQRVDDPGGKLAAAMGAATSGEIVLYGRSGELLFQGGVTPERGRAGVSEGSQALRAALRRALSEPPAAGQPAGRETGGAAAALYPVFGCPLHSAPAGGGV